MLLDSESKRALLCADMFVLITINSFRRVVSVFEAKTSVTASLPWGEFLGRHPFSLLALSGCQLPIFRY
jgi:hypothetical protein